MPTPSCRPGSARWPGCRRCSRWTRRTTTGPSAARDDDRTPAARRRGPDPAARAARRRLRLPRRHPGAARRVVLGARRAPDGAGRPLGCRQVDAPGAGRGLLPAQRGRDPLGRAPTSATCPGRRCGRGMGYVEQEAPVLAGTVRENLLLAAPGRHRRRSCGRCWPTSGLTAGGARSVRAGPGRAGRRRRRAAVRRGAPAAGHRPLAAGPAGAAAARRADRQPRRPQRDAAARRPWPTAAADRALLVVAHRLSTVLRHRPDRGAGRRAGWSPSARTTSWSRPTRSTASWPPRSCWSEPAGGPAVGRCLAVGRRPGPPGRRPRSPSAGASRSARRCRARRRRRCWPTTPPADGPAHGAPA